MTLPDTNPKTAEGRKKPPMRGVPTTALRQLGLVMDLGERKYGRFNWRRHAVSATVYYDAIHRHLMEWYEGLDTDPESGQSPLAHIMACCSILIDAADKKKFNDDRDPT